MLHRLVNVGPTLQRDLGQLLGIERATLSGVVATLVRKGLVDQQPDAVDQRQRLLSVTDAGRALWDRLPDPVALALDVSFAGADEADLAVARRVLQAATRRLEEHLARGGHGPRPLRAGGPVGLRRLRPRGSTSAASRRSRSPSPCGARPGIRADVTTTGWSAPTTLPVRATRPARTRSSPCSTDGKPPAAANAR